MVSEVAYYIDVVEVEMVVVVEVEVKKMEMGLMTFVVD